MNLDIRDAVPEDAAGVAAVQVTAWQAAYRGILPASYLDGLSVAASAPRWQRIIEARNPSGGGRVLVAVDGGTVVGFNSFGPSRDGDTTGAGEVYAFYVAPDKWRLGIGRALMDATLENLKASGFEDVTLWVLEANAIGRAFYEKEGWLADGASKPVDERVSGGEDLVEVRYRRRCVLDFATTHSRD